MYLESGVLPTSDKDARRIVLSADQYAVYEDVLYHLYTPRIRTNGMLERADENEIRIIKQIVAPLKMRIGII